MNGNLDVSERSDMFFVQHSRLEIDPANRTVGHQEIFNNL